MKHVLVLFATLMSASAFAQSTTEFFHMPAAGVSEVTPHAGYRTSTLLAKAPGSTESSISGLDRLGVTYKYGINPLFSLGADLSYSTYTISNGGGDSKGLEPLALFLDGQLPMAMGVLQYGLEGSIGLEKAKIETGKANRSYGDVFGNFPAGGFKLAPYVGYTFNAGSVGSFGGRVAYQLINSDTKVDIGSAGGEGTFSGGAQGNAALFYETLAADITLGAALTYDWFTKVEQTSPAPTTTVVDSRSLIGVRLYSAMPFGEGITFLPSLVWREKASSDTLDKLSDLRLTVAGRFAF